ncbi:MULTISPECIES: DUF4910 domain-containing protein [unclassified Serratia (in: enterobacteria)]|uniref:DUF4910 domain-containing protein n=1 Tax=unclassified Serratia (in: enterobacteria) TaxID=2647522 RepID=UPI002ED20AA0|nr:DUF4910 domain-containing protein [Serratia sp. C2(2)]MEE4448987.1 DUF4910 domain-containing protein [Serratia sp. C2(1)]
MLTAQRVAWVLQHSSTSRLMHPIEALGKFDRFQASLGIEQAAQWVATAARQRGLMPVDTLHFPADGKQQWWEFTAPLAWTPLRAWLRVSEADNLLIDHQQQAFAIATYSCAVTRQHFSLVTPEETQWQGKILVIPSVQFSQQNWPDLLAQRGAAGFITDAPARHDPQTKQTFRGRIELPADSPLFAFSATPEELTRLIAAARQHGKAQVEICLDHTATMPVVTACMPGCDTTQEIWLTAHLCHSRAGANDNASGISALLETATLMAQLQKERTFPPLRYSLRFVWGPEFLGVAALQHHYRHHPAPLAVINLDMVGENQTLCGSPLCIEHPLQRLSSPLGSLAEQFAAEVFRQTADSGGQWLSLPFHGFSDHALFMNHNDHRRNSPAIQICHIGDRFNHSAGDTLDKVSSVEMKRTLAIVVPLLQALQQQPPEYFAQKPHVSDQTADGLYGHWSGPLNLRRLIQTLPPTVRHPLENHLARDKRYLAAFHHCVLNADGRAWPQIVEATRRELGFILPTEVEESFRDALFSSPWFKADSPHTGIVEEK